MQKESRVFCELKGNKTHIKNQLKAYDEYIDSFEEVDE